MAATPAKPRRIGRILAWLLAVVVLAVGVSIVAYVRSGDRVVAFLATVLSRDYLVQLELGAPAEVAWWPQIALRLRDVRLRTTDVEQPLLTADELRVRATWGSLFGGDVELTELSFDRPTVNAGAVATWSMRYAALEQGPLPPLRVPTVTTVIHVRDLAIAFDDGSARHFPSVAIEPIERGRPLQIDAEWLPQGKTEPWTILADSVADDTPSGLVFRGLVLDVRDPADTPQLIARGDARYDAATAWSFDGSLRGALLADAGLDDGPMPVKIARAARPALSIVANGTRDGAAFDVNLAFATMPDISQSPDRWLATFTDDATGSARIDKLTLGGVELEGVSFEAGPDSAAADGAKPAQAQ